MASEVERIGTEPMSKLKEGRPIAVKSGTGSVPVLMGASKRLQRELLDIIRDPPPYCIVAPKSSGLHTWEACIRGPDGSPYEGGSFFLDIRFPREYPFSPPIVRFRTKIYHCNIHHAGKVCLDILKDEWSPALTASGVLLSIVSLLTDPNPLDPLEPAIAKQYLSDRELHDETVAEWTRRYAMGLQIEPQSSEPPADSDDAEETIYDELDLTNYSKRWSKRTRISQKAVAMDGA